MPTSMEFVHEVDALALTITGYQTGKSGQNGLCDCIGLVMGAMSNLGRGSYPMHSTNYFARYQMDTLRVLKSGETLQVGQLLYKANDDQSDLNDRYKPGGRYYVDSNLKNYYHVGVITGLNPLEITHCTSDGTTSGIKRDSSTKGWTHVGELRGVSYALNIADQNKEEPVVTGTAYVANTDGKPVRLRSAPTTNGAYNTIKKVDVGTLMDVLEVGTSDGEEWATVVDPMNVKGYMMTKFLNFVESAENAAESAEDLKKPASVIAFEQDVVERLTRIETLLDAILNGGVG